MKYFDKKVKIVIGDVMELFENIVLEKIEEIVTIYSPKGRFDTITNRKWYALTFCSGGQITYFHNGKEFVSAPGYAVILPKGQSYSLRGDKKGTFPVINFSAKNFSCDEITVIPINDEEAFIRDYEKMKTLFLFERNRARVMGIFYDMVHRIVSGNNSTQGVLGHIIDFIESSYTCANLTNKSLAQTFGISEVYLRKLFTKHFATTPKQYIIDIRICQAKRLLAEGHIKISDISEMCGFTNQYHFCRIFKEKTGQTPTEYMKENRIYKI